MRKLLAVILLICTTLMQSRAQDTLPGFSVMTRGSGKVIISWTNHYPVVSQISIQRSIDSTRNFKTILTVPDPSVLQNGFVDTKAQTPYMFYRLFIVQDSGKYLFTKSKRPTWDTSKIATTQRPIPENNQRVVIEKNVKPSEAEILKEKIREPEKVIPVPEKFYVIKRHDSIINMVPEKDFKMFRDSIVRKTKDTIAFSSLDTIVIKPFIPKEVYKPSIYVYTEKDGNIAISLPDVSRKTYRVKFFDDKENPLFEIKKVKESSVLLDKVNFLHSGWFHFELYEDGKLKEKHRFFIPKDF